MTTTHTTIDTPLGELTLVAENSLLTGVYFPGHWTRPDRTAFGERSERGFEEVGRQLAEYFAGERTSFDLALDLDGTEFQQRVWRALLDIPYGETSSYGELAGRIGAPGAARAVGLANGQNPIAVIVPCHRVIGANGTLTGYGGGLERKRLLLDLEAGVAPLPYVPVG
jgi:methylated-DNA-[protein]-cysteine S-methyltransferase